MLSMNALYRLKIDDIPKAAKVLSGAFFHDPDLEKVIPEDTERHNKLKIMFQVFVKFGILYGEVYAPSPKIEGISLWVPSKTKKITSWRAFRSGFMGMVSKLNATERKLFIQYGKEMDEHTLYLLKNEHWFLFILGVDPAHQMKGFGTQLLEPMLKRALSEKVPVMLDTNKEKNVAYYERFGFKVEKRYTVFGNQHWGMVCGLDR
jgi:ribosomal protein S18 acetylase RimI-like enzyme